MLANYQQTRTPLITIIVRGTVIGRDRAGVIIACGGRRCFVDQAHFLLCQPSRSRIAKTKRLAFRSNVAAREDEFPESELDRKRKDRVLTE